MSNNSMIEYKKSFMSKIKSFLKNIFKNKQLEPTYIEKTSNNSDFIMTTNKTEKDFLRDIKVDISNVDKVIDKKNFLEYIDGNAEALKMLSFDRLIKLKKYYDEVIEENDKIIENLKKSS